MTCSTKAADEAESVVTKGDSTRPNKVKVGLKSPGVARMTSTSAVALSSSFIGGAGLNANIATIMSTTRVTTMGGRTFVFVISGKAYFTYTELLITLCGALAFNYWVPC